MDYALAAKVTDADIKATRTVGVAQRIIVRRLITVPFECCGAFIDWERFAQTTVDTGELSLGEAGEIKDVEVTGVDLR